MTQYSPAEQTKFADMLVKIGRKLRTAFDARLRAEGLTLARGRILLILSKRDGVTLTDLAQELEVETPTAVRLLDGLEKAQLLERLAVPEDRRVKRLALTPAGIARAAKVSDMAVIMRQDLLQGIPAAQLDNAMAVFEAMERNLTQAVESTDVGGGGPQRSSVRRAAAVARAQ